MLVTSLRGIHLAGVATVYRPGYGKTDQKHIFRVSKVLGHPGQLLTSKSYAQTTGVSSGGRLRTALFGHCRAATKGHLSASNAHPFVTTNLVGVHNGTITSGITIPDGETDSQALFESIDRDGLVPTLSKVVGAYALIWYDNRDGSINFIRNNDRTLFYARRNSSVIVSSEESMLRFIGDRSGNIKDTFPNPVHYKKALDPGSISSASGASYFEETDLTKELRGSLGGAPIYRGFQSRIREYGWGHYEAPWDDDYDPSEGKPQRYSNASWPTGSHYHGEKRRRQ